MIALISGVVQLIFLILKNKYEMDDKKKADKEKLHADWADAVKSGDTARISDMLARMRALDA